MFGRAQRDERKEINAAAAPGLRPHAGREKNNRIRLVRGRSRHCHETLPRETSTSAAAADCERAPFREEDCEPEARVTVASGAGRRLTR